MLDRVPLMVATLAHQRRYVVLRTLFVEQIRLRLGALRLFSLIAQVFEVHLLGRFFDLDRAHARSHDQMVVTFSLALLRCFIDIGARPDVRRVCSGQPVLVIGGLRLAICGGVARRADFARPVAAVDPDGVPDQRALTSS